MIAVGYLAKQNWDKKEGFEFPNIADVYSVSSCCNEDFADYIQYWKHNGYWVFDSPKKIAEVAKAASVDLKGSRLFYYEAYEQEFDGDGWCPFSPEPSIETEVVTPTVKVLEGFDVVTFSVGRSPECSPLSCNGLAQELDVNRHCLFETFDLAKASLDGGKFVDCEPGPYRIIAVFAVEWPESIVPHA